MAEPLSSGKVVQIVNHIHSTKTATFVTPHRKWQTEEEKLGLCVKCGKPAQIHSRGKRAGAYSIYCLDHLLEQRKRNRYRSEFHRWNRAGGDPAAWAAVAAWKAQKLQGGFFRGFMQKFDNSFMKTTLKLAR